MAIVSILVPFQLALIIGTSICGESALQFARVTGSSVSLDDLSTNTLSLEADYNSTVESSECSPPSLSLVYQCDCSDY